MRPFSFQSMLRAATALCFLGLLACGSGRGDGSRVLFRHENLDGVKSSGLAMTPVGHQASVDDAAEVAAFLTNQLYGALVGSLVGVSIVSPEQGLEQMALHGDEGLQLFRDFRKARVRGDELDADQCRDLSRLLLHRYVLISWVNEEAREGLEENARDNYTEIDFAEDLRRDRFMAVHGWLHGEIIDLWENQRLWAGIARYESARLFSSETDPRVELERARSNGAVRLATLLSSL